MVKNFLLPLLFFGLCASAQIQPIGVATNVVFAHGDIPFWSGSEWILLNKGTNGQVLTTVGTNVAWATPAPSSGSGTGLVTSVSTDFRVSGGELSLTNTLGTGPMVRQSVANSGTVTSVSGASTVSGLGFSGPPVTGFGTLTLTGIVAEASISLEIPRLSSVNTYTATSNILTGDLHVQGSIFTPELTADLFNVGTFVLGTNVIGLANGGTSATNAAGARAALGTDNADNITSGTLAEARIDSAIARLDSPAFTNSPTAPTASPGTSNSVLATTAFVRQNAGTGSGSFTNRPNRKRLVLFEKDWVTLTPANSALPELVGTAVSSGSATVIASESNHLGLLRLSSSATPNSAYYFLSSILGLFAQPVLTWESISRVRATNSGVSISHGFTDSATIANPTDAIRMYRSNDFLIPQIWYNGALTQGFEYPIQSNQFVYLRFQVQPSMTNVTFYAEDSDTKTLILSTNLNSTLPSDSNRSFGVGRLAASTNAVALTLEDLDWSTAYVEGEVDR